MGVLQSIDAIRTGGFPAQNILCPPRPPPTPTPTLTPTPTPTACDVYSEDLRRPGRAYYILYRKCSGLSVITVADPGGRGVNPPPGVFFACQYMEIGP